MSTNKCVVLLVFVAFLNRASPLSAAEPQAELTSEPPIEQFVTTIEQDTFPAVAKRELGLAELGIALAVYNRLPYDTVFDTGQTIIYPTRFSKKPGTLKVIFTKCDVSYRPDGNEFLSGLVSKGSTFNQTDIIVTGNDGFISLALPSGDLINLQPESRFQLTQLQCLPNDANCGVLVNEASGQIYVNTKDRDGQFYPISHPLRYSAVSVRSARHFSPSASFDIGIPVKKSGPRSRHQIDQ